VMRDLDHEARVASPRIAKQSISLERNP
jgi:hypothetical protein